MKGPSSAFDILIVGAGITGSALAGLLAGRGYSVAIVERSNLRGPKSGESLSPECRRYLDLLGFRVEADCGIDYVANISCWGGDEPAESNFIFNPYGNGIAIDKSRFERKLLHHAGQRGAAVYFASSIIEKERSRGRWRVKVRTAAGATEQLSTRLLFIAGGRNSSFQRGPASRVFHDKLVARSTIVPDVGTGARTRILYIESLLAGWFYTNALPGGKRVFTLFTDGDLLPPQGRSENHFRKLLGSTLWFRRNGFSLAEAGLTVRTFDARTSWSNRQAGPGWVGVGDTAYTIDPLSGQGIQKNLEMVEYCAENIRPLMNFEHAARESYVSHNAGRFNYLLGQGRSVAEAEKRWSSEAFWHRRHDRSSPQVRRKWQVPFTHHLQGSVAICRGDLPKRLRLNDHRRDILWNRNRASGRQIKFPRPG